MWIEYTISEDTLQHIGETSGQYRCGVNKIDIVLGMPSSPKFGKLLQKPAHVV